jgi:hypothetical protein
MSPPGDFVPFPLLPAPSPALLLTLQLPFPDLVLPSSQVGIKLSDGWLDGISDGIPSDGAEEGASDFLLMPPTSFRSCLFSEGGVASQSHTDRAKAQKLT